MGIVMPETCWAYKKYNKIISGILLVCYSSVITMMHGPINIRLKPMQITTDCNNSTKTVRHKICKTICTIGLEIYAWRWLIKVETCGKVNIYVILKLSKYIILLCRRKIYCRFTINRLSDYKLYTYISDFPARLRSWGYTNDICPAFDQLHVAVLRMVLLLSNLGCSECIKMFWAI